MENLYLIELWNNNERFFKIGTTVHKYYRFYEIMKHGYRVNIVYMLIGLDFNDAINAERRLQSIFESYTPKQKFGGYTECFKIINLDYYKNQIKNLQKTSSEIIENLEITWR